MSDEILDYADLIARYESGLVEQLRNFGFQTEYLDLWVPDEDLTRSLLNLFDAAAEGGLSSLSVRVPADAVAGLKLAGLPELAAKRGRFSIEDGSGKAVLSITDLRIAAAPSAARGSASPQSVAPGARTAPTVGQDKTAGPLRQPQALSEPYAAHLLRIADKSLPSAPIPPETIRARAEIDGLVLDAAIDPTDHRIVEITQSGARNPVAHDLVSVLARTCHGLPVLEAADHGSIRLEYLLRGDAARPHAGIVIPETVEPAFRLITALLRALLADYRQKAGFCEQSNTFDAPPGPRWLQADEAARHAQLAEAFARGGFAADDVNVVAIEYDVRVVVSLSGTLAKNPAGAVVALERCMKKHVDNRLELFLTEVKDSNKLRRLSEQKSKAS